MKQKLSQFKSKIRRTQIQNIFKQKRMMMIGQNSIINSQTLRIWTMRSRHQNQSEQDIETDRGQQPLQCSVLQMKHKWDVQDNELAALINDRNHQGVLYMAINIYRDLKKIQNQKSPEFQPLKYELYQHFLSKRIFFQPMNYLIYASQNNLSPALIQKLSIVSIQILDICIFNHYSKFPEQHFLQSNILQFLNYAINDPRYDVRHMSRVLMIITHLIISSVNQTKRLFEIMNNRNSVFSFGSVFYNLSKIPMKPCCHITQNFIIFMKFYLLQIQNEVNLMTQKVSNMQLVTHKKKATLSIIGLTFNELSIAFQVTIRSCNKLSDIYFDKLEEIDDLQESLEVLRILLELFDLQQKALYTIDFGKLVNLLSIKSCKQEIKNKVLIILDHGSITNSLLNQCELIDRLWGLRKDSYCFVMNILSNLVLDKKIKEKNISKIGQNIFLSLKLQEYDKQIMVFTYHWFTANKFIIQSGLDKLVLGYLSQSNSQDEQVNKYQCLIWSRIISNNNNIPIPIPQRILNMDQQSIHLLRKVYPQLFQYAL